MKYNYMLTRYLSVAISCVGEIIVYRYTSLLLRLLQSKHTYLISTVKSPDGNLLFMHSKCSAHAKSHLKDFQTIYKVGGGGANFEKHYLIQNKPFRYYEISALSALKSSLLAINNTPYLANLAYGIKAWEF